MQNDLKEHFVSRFVLSLTAHARPTTRPSLGEHPERLSEPQGAPRLYFCFIVVHLKMVSKREKKFVYLKMGLGNCRVFDSLYNHEEIGRKKRGEIITTITTPFFSTFPRGSGKVHFQYVTPLGSGTGEKETQTLKWSEKRTKHTHTHKTKNKKNKSKRTRGYLYTKLRKIQMLTG